MNQQVSESVGMIVKKIPLVNKVAEKLANQAKGYMPLVKGISFLASRLRPDSQLSKSLRACTSIYDEIG